MSEYDYDLFVIGAGSGGVRAARVAASMGAKVGIAEEFRVGGTCVIRGCVPKKLLVYASKFSGMVEDAEGYGWTIPEIRLLDWQTLIKNKDREIDRLNAIYLRNLERSGVEVFETRAVLADRHTIKAGRPRGNSKRQKHPDCHWGDAVYSRNWRCRARHYLQ